MTSVVFARSARCGVICALLPPAVFGSALSAVPPGKAVEARLLTAVSSYATKRGAPVEAVITTPLCGASGDELARGAVLSGRVIKVHRVGLGLIHETAGMRMEFNRLVLPDGRTFEITSRLTGIDNSRERIDRHGSIHGIRATATLSNRALQHV